MGLWARIGRLTLVLGVVAALVVAVGCGDDDDGNGGGGSEPAELTVGAWGGTIDKATKAYYTDPYSDETGDSFVFDDAPAAQLARLQAQNKAGNVTWDLLDSVGADNAWPLYEEQLLEPLPAGLKARLTAELGKDKVTDFGFTHANIAHVVVCNLDQVDKCPKNMAEFFDVEQFPGSRMFPGIGAITATAMAQSALGVPPEQIANDPPDLDAVFGKLDEVKPEIKVFFTSGDQQEQVMRSGEADMGIMWSGRAYALKAQGMNLEINWDGGVYEPSYWAVPAGAPHKQAAFKLIEWIATNVDGQSQWANELHYSVPNPKALDKLPANVQEELADTPSNFEQIVTPNYPWYAQNTKAVDGRFQDYVKG